MLSEVLVLYFLVGGIYVEHVDNVSIVVARKSKNIHLLNVHKHYLIAIRVDSDLNQILGRQTGGIIPPGAIGGKNPEPGRCCGS